MSVTVMFSYFYQKILYVLLCNTVLYWFTKKYYGSRVLSVIQENTMPVEYFQFTKEYYTSKVFLVLQDNTIPSARVC